MSRCARRLGPEGAASGEERFHELFTKHGGRDDDVIIDHFPSFCVSEDHTRFAKSSQEYSRWNDVRDRAE